MLLHSLKRDVSSGLGLGALVFGFALTWGSPMLRTISVPVLAQGQEQSQQQQPQPDRAKSATFTGTVVRNGEQFVLRNASGTIYRLDNAARVQPFEGKAVKVTGRLDEEAKLIHIDSIQGAQA